MNMLAPVALPEVVVRPGLKKSAYRARPVQAPHRQWKTVTEPSLLLSILISSVALHLLFVGVFGAGIPQLPRPRAKQFVPPPSEVKLIEEVKLEPEPVQPKELLTQQDEALPQEEAAAMIDLPPVSPVEPISAVPISVPVAFGIQVKGPVRLVDDPARASGTIGGRSKPTAPVSLDGGGYQEKNLLLPHLIYPPEAIQRQQTGAAQVEFHTTETGDIYDVTVRESSGFPALDRAAVNNLKHGRWVGAAGYYIKRFEFKLN
jgi:protein TonB